MGATDDVPQQRPDAHAQAQRKREFGGVTDHPATIPHMLNEYKDARTRQRQ